MDSCLLADYGIVSCDTKTIIDLTYFYTVTQFALIPLVTGEPEYDKLNQIWKSQHVPDD